jgi:hypothetical protein
MNEKHEHAGKILDNHFGDKFAYRDIDRRESWLRLIDRRPLRLPIGPIDWSIPLAGPMAEEFAFWRQSVGVKNETTFIEADVFIYDRTIIRAYKRPDGERVPELEGKPWSDKRADNHAMVWNAFNPEAPRPAA